MIEFLTFLQDEDLHALTRQIDRFEGVGKLVNIEHLNSAKLSHLIQIEVVGNDLCFKLHRQFDQFHIDFANCRIVIFDKLNRDSGHLLDLLQNIQAAPATVTFVENDYPAVREVDMKLIELAMEFEAKIVTNDFNLNKVAQLRGVEVLNINELANALKPVYLPGESMKVFILKEGKEFNQGIAYLDDGTMVVVDNARKMIGKTVDSSVTSVLQTTAGKMIFGKYEERQRGDAGTHGSHGREDRPERTGPDRPAHTEVSQ